MRENHLTWKELKKPMNKLFLRSLIFLLFSYPIFCQNIQLNPENKYQTIHSFGASDCWSIAMVGKNYPLEKKKKIAEWLFSTEKDQNGNPKGIGLSMWRFNIGAGSFEQGNDSKINSEWRRAETLLSLGKYNWTKQEGQQWFLEAAKNYQVPYTLGFLNSAPVEMTKNGLAFGNGQLGEWNFNKDKINEWSIFLSEVSKHFQFTYISPFNEPQWDWGPNKSGKASQEGSPINNPDIAWAVRNLASTFQKNNTPTTIVIPEAGQLNYLFAEKTNRPNQDQQIESFFSPSSPHYVGNIPNVEKIISGHSYFTTSPEKVLTSTREEVRKSTSTFGLGFWQSEYCVLGNNAGEINGSGVDLGIKTALYVAKVIHADLVHANASSWSWWLAVSANDYKDGLIYTFHGTNKGENDGNKYDADLYDSKTLWALGNYSLFVRPGMQRVEATIQQPNCLISAYSDSKTTVLVLINSGESCLIELPKNLPHQKINSYTTSYDQNLAYQSILSNQITLTASSITTILFE